jgi:hypothetical protein
MTTRLRVNFMYFEQTMRKNVKCFKKVSRITSRVNATKNVNSAGTMTEVSKRRITHDKMFMSCDLERKRL